MRSPSWRGHCTPFYMFLPLGEGYIAQAGGYKPKPTLAPKRRQCYVRACVRMSVCMCMCVHVCVGVLRRFGVWHGGILAETEMLVGHFEGFNGNLLCVNGSYMCL